MSNFQDLIKKRRTIYNLGTNVSLSQSEIVKIIEACAWDAPSAFNMQTPRLIVLFGDPYQNFWRLVRDELAKIVPSDKMKATEERVKTFATGIGTVLFFEDDAITKDMQIKLPAYKDKFPEWAEHNNANVQYAIWLALAEQNIGASLQHYNPVIDDAVRKAYNVPANWRLIAQMPFGSIEKPADTKEHTPISERMKVFS